MNTDPGINCVEWPCDMHSDCPVYLYTHGQCVAFAIALYRTFESKYPLYTIFHCQGRPMATKEIMDESACPERRDVLHAFCMVSEDKQTIMDARGVKPIEYIYCVYKNIYSKNGISLGDFKENYLVKIEATDLIGYCKGKHSTSDELKEKEANISDAIEYIISNPRKYVR